METLTIEFLIQPKRGVDIITGPWAMQEENSGRLLEREMSDNLPSEQINMIFFLIANGAISVSARSFRRSLE